MRGGGLAHRLTLSWDDAKWYGRQKRPVALVRALWMRLVRRAAGELCEVCGRRYVLWCAPTWLFVKVHGSRYGTLCPPCFTKAAATKRLVLLWVPEKFSLLSVERQYEKTEEPR